MSENDDFDGAKLDPDFDDYEDVDDDLEDYGEDFEDYEDCGCRCCENRIRFGFCSCQFCEGLWPDPDGIPESQKEPEGMMSAKEYIDLHNFEEKIKECSCVYCSAGEKDKCLSKAWGSIK